MRQYELYLVIDAEAEEEEASAILEKVTQLITAGPNEQKGDVIKVEARGKRRLAYPIGKTVESQDVILNFHAPAQVLPEIERVLKLEERVLRYLLVRVEEA